ncbi:MAG: hypothetical protein J2P37_21685, partial [Ktedonobacteraceae bacterium]|nr:hypothetical protein [Ktedonobacteraceae bacterium]
MSGKNNHTQPPDPQIQQLINTHQSIAANLHNNTSEEDIRETLAPCFDLPEESQLTLLKALASEQTVQAADIALAIQTYTEIKAVRKEARRALLQLQSARIYPAWEPAPAPSITQMIQQFAAPAPIGDDDDDADYDVAPARPQSLMGTLENDLSLLRSMFMGKPAEGAIENFLIAWSDGRYNEAYDLLALDSPLREGLTRKQWVKRRQQWRQQSQPGELKIGFMHTPATATGPDQETVVDTGWSLAFANRPDHDEVLPELPQATLTYAESGRHWFWSSYTLTEEHGKPRIMQMTDEGTRASQLPTSELQQRLDEIAALATERYTQLEAEAREMNEALEEDEDDEVEELNTEELSNTEELEDEETDLDDLEDDEDDDDEDDSDLAWEFGTMMERAQEAFHITTRALHYSDALIAQEPTADITIYQKAFEQSGITQDLERAATYAQLMAERFPAQRSEALCMLATAQTRIGEMLADEMDDEQAEHYAALAEKTLREAFETYNDPTS